MSILAIDPGPLESAEGKVRIAAIDPGNTASGYVIIDSDYRPIEFGKRPNEELLGLDLDGVAVLAIEMVASYGMAVGAEVFDTCVWIGRFAQRFNALRPLLVKRRDVKLAICHSGAANDSNVRQALVDRFAYAQPNHGKGTKAAPGWFFGFHADVWQAYALAVKALDDQRGRP